MVPLGVSTRLSPRIGDALRLNSSSKVTDRFGQGKGLTLTRSLTIFWPSLVSVLMVSVLIWTLQDLPVASLNEFSWLMQFLDESLAHGVELGLLGGVHYYRRK